MVSAMGTSTATAELTSSLRKAGTNNHLIAVPTGNSTPSLNWGRPVSKLSDTTSTVMAIPMSSGEWGTNSVCTG